MAWHPWMGEETFSIIDYLKGLDQDVIDLGHPWLVDVTYSSALMTNRTYITCKLSKHVTFFFMHPRNILNFNLFLCFKNIFLKNYFYYFFKLIFY
jgi:hypothetical protein